MFKKEEYFNTSKDIYLYSIRVGEHNSTRHCHTIMVIIINNNNRCYNFIISAIKTEFW